MMLLEYFIFEMITFLITGTQCKVTEVFAEAGSEAVLPCKFVSKSFASHAIIWSKGNQGTVWRKQRSGLQYWGASWSHRGGNQRIQCPNSQFESGDYSLQINNVREDDGGDYSCSRELGHKVDKNVVMLRIIKVSVSPSVSISGRDVSVACSVTPWPYGGLMPSVHWLLNNNPIFPQTEISLNGGISKSSVREKATARITGNWTCVVSYKGTEGQASATLSVKGIIEPPDDNTKVYAAVGSAAALPCVFSPDLIPSLPVWEKLKHGSLFRRVPGHLPPSFSASSQSSQLAWDKSASLKEVEFTDEGRYRCSGTVQGQRLTRNIQLVTAKIDSSVPSKKKGSMMLTCQLSDVSQVTNYEWLHVTYDLNGTQKVEFIQKGKTLSIDQGSEENQGEWACRFSGKEGILGNATYHIQVMSGLSGQKSTGFSRNTATVVGLSFLLLVLLLILAQMYKNYQRRKRIFQYPALETIVHTISNEREERERNQVKN